MIMTVTSFSKRHCLGRALLVFLMVLNLGGHLRVILFNDILLLKVEVCFRRVSKLTELLIIDDYLLIFANVHTGDECIDTFPVLIEDNQFLIDILLVGSLGLENLPGKHHTDL